MNARDRDSGSSREQVRAEAFRRIAQRRTYRVLESLRLLGQCSNRRSYEYSNEQVARIFREIRGALRRAERSFDSNRRNTDFRL